MRNSYTLGRVAGIEIGINWSVLALLALIMWTLATGVFPDQNPGLGDNSYFAMAVIASFGFFASILLHELGHALQARRDGMDIDGITLWLFGGVARYNGMFPSAGAEFRIAVAGPLVSLLLAAGLIGATWLPGLPDQADGVVAWLGIINAALLIFNLIPALPLDGGRMLRAALWAWKGDLQSATRMAAGAGRVLAIGMIGLGLAIAVLGQGIDGIWLAMIGWFVLQAAGAESQYVKRVAPRPVGPRVGDMMDHDPVTTRPELTLDEFSRLSGVDLARDAYAVLGDDGRPVGLIPTSCLREVPAADWGVRTVADCMIGRDHVPALTAESSLDDAMEALRRSPVRRVLVVDGERLVGLLSLDDVARTLGLRPVGPRAET
ncbi:MAG TPA: site-2 protease family protein [Miltoncostaea sp.]|nr:site-2 protease family protein [Miltoncostaea sp.]